MKNIIKTSLLAIGIALCSTACNGSNNGNISTGDSASKSSAGGNKDIPGEPNSYRGSSTVPPPSPEAAANKNMQDKKTGSDTTSNTTRKKQ